ncbi:hypothetical protein SY83_03130 [Paenibacillus swuensis]|uniref:Immunity protein 63 domain-containing protein n=1 Tax=Paenibacillus swuensis TaxID=1178515 RepID=A0A172TEK5_9BACL|nr:hypothetical protein [Paenibacillus swuensis]ANE45478.1 hypothetical protein SY83_03130 [Paenibacillus swuensis]
MTTNNYITFGSQMGDEASATAVSPHLIELRKLLKRFCNHSYSPDVDEIALIGRIDGEIWYWEFEGCKYLKLYTKQRYITVDIGMPKEKWQKKSNADIRNYLYNWMHYALELVVLRIKEKKLIINEEQLFIDLGKVKQRFLE